MRDIEQEAWERRYRALSDDWFRVREEAREWQSLCYGIITTLTAALTLVGLSVIFGWQA